MENVMGEVRAGKTNTRRPNAQAEKDGDLPGWVGKELADAWAKHAARKYRSEEQAETRQARCGQARQDQEHVAGHLGKGPDT